MQISTWILNVIMDVLANLNAFVHYIALPQETYDAYICNLKLVMAKVI